MAHAAFDTLEFVDRLEKSGLSEKQARAITFCDHFIDTYIMTPAIAAAHPDTSMSCNNGAYDAPRRAFGALTAHFAPLNDLPWRTTPDRLNAAVAALSGSTAASQACSALASRSSRSVLLPNAPDKAGRFSTDRAQGTALSLSHRH